MVYGYYHIKINISGNKSWNKTQKTIFVHIYVKEIIQICEKLCKNDDMEIDVLVI